MNQKSKFIPLPGLLALYFLLSASTAYAYLDPNTTSLLTQIITPLLVMAATALTFMRKQLRSAMRWLSDRLTRR